MSAEEELRKCRLLQDEVRWGSLESVALLIDCIHPSYFKAWPSDCMVTESYDMNRREIAELLLRKGCKVNDGDNCRSLHSAVLQGDIEFVRMLLQSGAYVKAKDVTGSTPLQHAITKMDVEVVRLLVAAGADVNERVWSSGFQLPLCFQLPKSYRSKRPQESHLTPLHVFVQIAAVDMVDLLLESKAEVNAAVMHDVTPLHLAVQSGNIHVAERLLDHGADVNSTCATTFARRMTSLHLATGNDDVALVELLLSRGAVTNCVSHDDRTPMYVALERGREDIAAMLVRHGADVNTRVRNGRTMLVVAVEKGDLEVTKSVLKFHPNVNYYQNRKALFAAVSRCSGELHRNIVKCLMQHGFSIRPEDVNNTKLMIHAVEKGFLDIVRDLLIHVSSVNSAVTEASWNLVRYSLLHCAVEEKQLEVAKLLISFGAEVNSRDYSRESCRWHCGVSVTRGFARTPLLCAVENRDCVMAEMLLTNGAVLNERHKILNVAVKNGHRDMVELCLKHDADVNACDQRGMTPLHWTTQSKKVGISESFCSSHANIAKLLLSRGADGNAYSKDGTTALQVATFKGFAKLVEVLLEFRVDVDAVIRRSTLPYPIPDQEMGDDFVGRTALFLAARRGYALIVEMLLKCGADVNFQDPIGRTVLHVSAKGILTKVAELLLKYGANVDHADDEGKTPLHLAAGNRFASCAKLLLRHGADVNVTCRSNRTPLDDAMQFSRRSLEVGEPSVCDEISSIFKYHLIKLKVAGFALCDSNHRFLSRCSRVHHANVSAFETNCLRELEEMKRRKVDRDVSFYDILVKRNLNALSSYWKNSNIMQTIESRCYEVDYPLYSHMVFLQLLKGQERAGLLEMSMSSFCNVLGHAIPSLVSEKIFSYLCNKDLNNLVIAYS